MRADIHDGQEPKRSVQGPDTEAQDLSPPDHHFRLATRGRSIQMGHVWTMPAVQEESDVSAKRSGAAMYTACFRLEGLASFAMQPLWPLALM
jgi:hypothetical protein